MEGSKPEQEQEAPVKIVTAETTWLEQVIHFEWKDTADGGKILLYTLSNGHRYAIPLNARLLELTRQAISPIAVVGADALPQRPRDCRLASDRL